MPGSCVRQDPRVNCRVDGKKKNLYFGRNGDTLKKKKKKKELIIKKIKGKREENHRSSPITV